MPTLFNSRRQFASVVAAGIAAGVSGVTLLLTALDDGTSTWRQAAYLSIVGLELVVLGWLIGVASSMIQLGNSVRDLNAALERGPDDFGGAKRSVLDSLQQGVASRPDLFKSPVIAALITTAGATAVAIVLAIG